MNVRKFVQGVVIIMILGGSTAALQAQTFRIFAMGTGSMLFNKRYYNVYGAALGSTYNIGDGYVVGGEHHLWKNLGVEGSYANVLNTLVVTDFYNAAVSNKKTGYNITNQRVSLDAIAYSPKAIKGVLPYISAGVELDRFVPTSQALTTAKGNFNGVANTVLSTDNKFGYNFGGGVEIKLISIVAVRVDLRDHITGSPTFGLPAQATTAFASYYPISGSADHVEASVGFVLQFGK